MVPFHTARPGETTRDVSQRYALRLKKLLRYNRMDRSESLQAGRVLWLRGRRPAKTPVEINPAPTPPVYDNSPATPSTRPIVERSGQYPQTSVPGANTIPRNASERKLYQPKLVGSATPTAAPTPADERVADTKPVITRPAPTATTTPSTTPASPMPQPVQPAAPTPTVTTAVVPDRSNPGETVEVPVALPRDAGSPQRTIIVRSEGETVRERTTPARPVTGSGTYPANPGPGESLRPALRLVGPLRP